MMTHRIVPARSPRNLDCRSRMGMIDGTYRELHPFTTLRAFVLMLARIGAVIFGLEAAGMTVEWLYHSDCHCMGKGKEVVLASPATGAET